MTAGPCFDPLDAAAVAALPDEHPLRAHARECPRCRAILDAYLAFVAADAGDVQARDLADADARLARALAGVTGVASARVAPADSRHPADARANGRRDPTFWERLMHPAMQPALAFAALALVVGAVLWWPRGGARPGEVTMRGGPRVVTLSLSRAERSDGMLHVAWTPVAGAEDYELRCFSGELTELGRVGPLTGDHADLEVTRLPFRDDPAGTLLVRVNARVGGDVIATSEARIVERR